MRALRFHGNKDIRIDDVPEPKTRPGWVKIKNAWSGICGSDLHEYTVGPMNTPITPHSLTGESLPTICGHEFAGNVVELGDGVTDLEIGQKVAIFPIISDSTCHWCQTGDLRLCENWGFLGYSGYGGGMAEYIAVERTACHKIPDHVGLDVAALVEPLAVGWHAVKEAKAGPGKHCLVIGAGPIGLSVVHCLVAHGVTSIIVSEPSDVRLAQAKAAGATHVVNPIKQDAVEFCRGVTDGFGAHAVFECAGMQIAFDTALNAVRGRGIIVNVAIYETDLREFDEVIDAIATGRIKNPENMITGRVALSNAIEGGFMELLASKDKHVKILVNPEA